MTTHDFTPPDYALLDGGDALEDPPTVEVVQWYARPGWPLGKLPPGVALVGAFALGAVAGAAVTVSAFLVRERLWPHATEYDD